MANGSSELKLHPALAGMRAVLFDVGGTLTHPDWTRLAALAREEAGREFDARSLERVFKDGLREHDACLKRGDRPPYDTAVRNWTFRLMYGGLGLEESCCARLASRLDEAHAERHLWCGVDADAERVLKTLKASGVKTAAVSNTEDGRLEELLTLTGLRPYLDEALDSFVVRLRKPDPSIFRLALSRLGVAPAEAAFVGDSYEADCAPALAAGLGAVLVDPLGLHPDCACPRVRSLGELIQKPEARSQKPE